MELRNWRRLTVIDMAWVEAGFLAPVITRGFAVVVSEGNRLEYVRI